MDFTAVFQPVCVGANAFQREEVQEQFVSRVGGVCSYMASPCLNLAVVYEVKVWERTSHSPVCGSHHLGQVLPVFCP